MGKVIMSGIVPQLEAPVTFAENFADNTWEQVIEACQKNKVPETWVVGDQKAMTINGTDYLIDIIGKNHDTYSDDSGKAPLTFQMHDCYGTTYPMNGSNTNGGGWTNCQMRSATLPAILALMPDEVQSGIKDVNKLTSIGSTNSTINTTADKLFLLSEIELLGITKYSYSGEGTQYDYYKAGNSTLKKTKGNVGYWWLRSPHSSQVVAFVAGRDEEGQSNGANASGAFGVAFAFCF